MGRLTKIEETLARLEEKVDTLLEKDSLSVHSDSSPDAKVFCKGFIAYGFVYCLSNYRVGLNLQSQSE